MHNIVNKRNVVSLDDKYLASSGGVMAGQYGLAQSGASVTTETLWLAVSVVSAVTLRPAAASPTETEHLRSTESADS